MKREFIADHLSIVGALSRDIEIGKLLAKIGDLGKIVKSDVRLVRM